MCYHGTFKSYITLNNGYIEKIISNPLEDVVNYWFCWLFVCYDIELLLQIISNISKKDEIDYTFDIIQPYISQKKLNPIILSKIFDCWNLINLSLTRYYYASSWIFE